jgi:hypothetical protein
MAEKCGQFVHGRWVEDLPATVAATGEPPGPELTEGAPVDPSTPPIAETIGGKSGPGAEETRTEEQPGSTDRAIPDLLSEASTSVTRAVDDLVRAARALVATEEGHQFIESKIEQAGENLSDVIRDLSDRLDATLKRK